MRSLAEQAGMKRKIKRQGDALGKLALMAADQGFVCCHGRECTREECVTPMWCEELTMQAVLTAAARGRGGGRPPVREQALRVLANLAMVRSHRHTHLTLSRLRTPLPPVSSRS